MSRNSKTQRLLALAKQFHRPSGKKGPARTQPKHGKRNRVARPLGFPVQKSRPEPEIFVYPTSAYEVKAAGVSVDYTQSYQGALASHGSVKTEPKALYRVADGQKHRIAI